MKIRLNLSDLNSAFDLAGTVKPKAGTSYVFRVTPEQCFLYAAGENHWSRTEVVLLESEGEGDFAYPVDRVDALRHLKGVITISSYSEGSEEEGLAQWVSYEVEDGPTSKRITTDPGLLTSLEGFLQEEADEKVVPSVLLRDGLGVASTFVGKKVDDSSVFKTVQIFDPSREEWAQGDGTLYAADGQKAYYYHSPELVGRGLSIHEKHVPRLLSFLGKCGTRVKVKSNKTMAFVIDQVQGHDGSIRDGSVFGWAKTEKEYTNYKYYSSKIERFILLVSRAAVLGQLNWMKSELQGIGKEKVRVVFSNKTLKFVSSGKSSKERVETAPISVVALELDDGRPSDESFEANANVLNLLDLFRHAKGNEVELRVGHLQDRALFRTVESFWLDDSGKTVISKEASSTPVYEVRATSFTTSLEG